MSISALVPALAPPDEPDCSHMGRAVDSHGEHFGSPGDLEDVINPAAGDFGKLG
jgi:hypothetical protein